MFETRVYHGTTSDVAIAIQSEGFKQSDKDNEWLGKGVYFFEKHEPASMWAKYLVNRSKDPLTRPSVIFADICCDENYLCDLDIKESLEKLCSFAEEAYKDSNSGVVGAPKLKSSQLRCVACNYYGKRFGIKVFAYTFINYHYNICGFPSPYGQKYYCVRDNDIISNVRLEMVDYAV